MVHYPFASRSSDCVGFGPVGEPRTPSVSAASKPACEGVERIVRGLGKRCERRMGATWTSTWQWSGNSCDEGVVPMTVPRLGLPRAFMHYKVSYSFSRPPGVPSDTGGSGNSLRKEDSNTGRRDGFPNPPSKLHGRGYILARLFDERPEESVIWN